ncbi:hypothetical protein HBI88_249260 [Parastagonospora nodorum]|nr:hypothetical protein HBI97_251780 [Parastagonospora nodorum]KAH5781798.1 hypothetical protein HBI96_250950 [Parastagonospora nodorum]KAH5794788.1 hypothetical protein HBI94_251630 [Parastagonospora nodorum]KAH5805627.1 hypothetical protein HBI93_251870 [Parastagonospora nodorum]KAH5844041.1 hypothetical protein HBI91_252670 [Parastagonospora nodorum]
MICGFQPKTYAGLAKHTARYRKVHVCAADSLSSTIIVYNHIEKDKNADLAIADGISDALDMCAKDDLIRRKGLLLTSTQTWEVLFQTHDRRLAGELATAESVTAKDPNYVDTFSSDFAFSFAAWLPLMARGNNILLLIAFIISHRLFADELVYALSQFFLGNTDYSVHGATVVLIIISVDKTQLLLILGDRSTPSTLLARFIPTTKIRDPLLKTLENAAKSGILLACADGRTRQCYPTICAILANYEEQVLLTSVKKNCYCTRCTRCLDKGHDDFVHLVNYFGWKHYNFNIHVSLATDTLHLLLKGLVIKMLDFMQDMLDDIYPGKQKAIIQQLVAVVSLLFILKAPFALHFIRAVCDLVTLAQYKSHDEDTLAYIQGALERMNVFKEEFRVYYRISVQIHPSIKCWRSSSKRYNDPEHCDEEVVRCAPNWQQTGLWRRDYSRTVTDSRVVAQLYLILIIIDYTCYDKDRKHMAYIRAFSKVLLFNNNGQIDNTTRMLTFKFYDLSTIICLVHLVPRDLPDSITRTTMSYYVNNYIDWDEYNRLYSLTFDIDLLRTLREYRRKRTRNN